MIAPRNIYTRYYSALGDQQPDEHNDEFTQDLHRALTRIVEENPASEAEGGTEAAATAVPEKPGSVQGNPVTFAKGSSGERKVTPGQPDPAESFWETQGHIAALQNIGTIIGNLSRGIGGRQDPVNLDRSTEYYARGLQDRRQRQAQALQQAEQAYDRQLQERRAASNEQYTQALAQAALRGVQVREQRAPAQIAADEARADLTGVRAQGLSISNSQARERDDADSPEAAAMRGVIMRIPQDERVSIGMPTDEEVAKLDAQALSEYLAGYRQLLLRRRASRGGGGGGSSRGLDEVEDALTQEYTVYRNMGDDPEHTRRLVRATLHPNANVRRTALATLQSAGRQGVMVGEDAARDLDAYNRDRGQTRVTMRAIERVRAAMQGMTPDQIQAAMLRRPLPTGVNETKYNQLVQAYENMSSNLRHALFGSALTGGELESWEAMTGTDNFADPHLLINFVNSQQEIQEQTEDYLRRRYPRAVRADEGQPVFRSPTGAAPRAASPPTGTAPSSTTPAAAAPAGGKRQYRVRTARGTAVYELTPEEASQAASRFGAQNVEAL